MRQAGKYRLSASATAVAVAVAAVCAVWLLGAFDKGLVGGGIRVGIASAASVLFFCRGQDWVGPFLRSPVTVLAGSLVLTTGVLSYLVLGMLWGLGRRSRAVGQSPEAGTAAVEFVLLLPLALMIVLIMMQSTLLVTGNLNVHYAAYAGARAAVVWVPEKLSYDEPRNVVLDEKIDWTRWDDKNPPPMKIDHITVAAVLAVMPVSAGKSGAGGASGADAGFLQQGMSRFYQLYGQQSPGWIQTMLASKWQYARDYTELTLDDPAGGQSYGDHEDLRVHVRHTLYLSIPYANRLFGQALAGGGGDYGVDVHASYALTNQGLEDEIDVEVFPRTVGRG